MAFGVCTNCLSSFPPSTSQKWKTTTQRLLDQSHAGPYIGGNTAYPPFWAFLGLFAYPAPRGGASLIPCTIIILSNKCIPQ